MSDSEKINEATQGYRDEVLERLKALEALPNTVHQIKVAVVGDKDYGTTGLVSRMAAVEVRLSSSENKFLFISGGVSMITIIGSGIAAWWAGHH